MSNQPDRGVAPRFSLCLGTQIIEWPTDDSTPVVDFLGFSEELDVYDLKAEALVAIDKYLAQVGATAEWSDVRPIENCPCCKGDVDTLKGHKVLSLLTLIRPDEDAITLVADYSARFCNTCVPVNLSGVSA